MQKIAANYDLSPRIYEVNLEQKFIVMEKLDIKEEDKKKEENSPIIKPEKKEETQQKSVKKQKKPTKEAVREPIENQKIKMVNKIFDFLKLGLINL